VTLRLVFILRIDLLGRSWGQTLQVRSLMYATIKMLQDDDTRIRMCKLRCFRTLYHGSFQYEVQTPDTTRTLTRQHRS
jgi:hypothetical protein